jgi:hypothetical protein
MRSMKRRITRLISCFCGENNQRQMQINSICRNFS